MENIRKKKKLLQSILCLVLAVAMLFAHFTFPVGLRAWAADEEDEYQGMFETAAVTITNGQFDSVSGSFPKSPSSWTGSFLETDSGEIISGVIDLSSSSYPANSSIYKLTEYSEYKKSSPQTPFGRPYKPNGTFHYYENTNTNVLMLNTNGLSTTYKYTSSSFSLAANSFYKISAWAKTGDFKGIQNSGAAIKLGGIENTDIGFNNINTVRDIIERDADGNPILSLEDNLFGWQEFTIYVSTDYKAHSVSLNLQIGDAGTNNDGNDYYYPTNGYAFFANVTAYQIAPEVFETETQTPSANIFVSNLNKGEYITKNNENGKAELDAEQKQIEIGSFNNVENGNYPVGWTSIDEVGAGGATVGIYNPAIFPSNNIFGLKNNPSAPNGIENKKSNNILIISSMNRSVATGLRSTNILIERNRYYRVAAWVKTQDVSVGAAMVISGENSIYDNELETISTNLVGDNQNLNRYGWKQNSFFIRGSSVMDCLVNVELWLGQIDVPSKGIAMFDDVTIETITEKEYNDNVASGTEVILDGGFADTGIANGMFYNAGTYEDYEYPLPPSQWTMYNAANSEATGYSVTPVPTDNIKSGIMPIDKDHFKNQQNYLNASNPIPNEIYPRNVLFMGSNELTAFGYRSSEISVSSDSITKIYVELMTDKIIGYGANLVLKNDKKVISTIENIDTNGSFETFDFYVEGHARNSNNITLEIWLGLGDKVQNQSKRAAGHVFVKEAGTEAVSTTDPFQTFIDDYKFANNANIVSLNTNYFINYNRYSNGFIKESFDWQLDTSKHTKANDARTDYGIFDYAAINNSGQSRIPSDFKLDESGNKNILFLENIAPNAATLIYQTNYTLDEAKYYKVSVSMKVDIPQEFLSENPNAIGAGIVLRGTTYAFEDIKDSRKYSPVYDETIKGTVEKLVDNDFKTYTFYVRCNEANSANISFEISLGGFNNELEFCQGRVYVADFAIEEMTEDDYDVNTKDLEDDDPYFINADLTTVEEDTTSTDTDNSEKDADSWWEKNWFVFPSLIFGLILLLVILTVFIRKFIDRRPKKAKKIKAKDYDRKAVLEKDGNATNEGIDFATISYDEFDDDITITKVETKPKSESKHIDIIESDENAVTTDESKQVDGSEESTTKTVNTDLSEFEE